MHERNIRNRVKRTRDKDMTSLHFVITFEFINKETVTSNIVTGNKPNFDTFCRFRFEIDEFAIK